MSSIAGHVSISKEKIGVVNLPLLNNPLHHLVLTAYHRCVAHNIIMMMVKFDCSGPATNHLQNLIDAVGINLFTVLIMTGCHWWRRQKEAPSGKVNGACCELCDVIVIIIMSIPTYLFPTKFINLFDDQILAETVEKLWKVSIDPQVTQK